MCITVCIYTVVRTISTGFSYLTVENSRIMLKIIKSMKQLNIGQMLAVYEESIRENGERFSLSNRQAEDRFLSYLEEDFFRQQGAFYAVWSVNNVYQSALRLEPFKDGLLLEALETAPNARRQGYAVALMQGVLEQLKESKYRTVYSHVNKRNRASFMLHQKCGFRIISDSATYIDGTVTQNSYTLCYHL